MKVKTTVAGADLTEGIRFYGDTYYDNESMERLKQLAVVLKDVVSDLEDLDRQVKDRSEGSAKEIKWQLDTMRNDLLWIAFGEEVAEEIIKLLVVRGRRTRKELWEALYELTEEQLRELAENICLNGLEAYICDDGYLGYRAEGSWGEFEDKIIGTLTLSDDYWRGDLIEWGLYNEGCRGINGDADWAIVEEFINEGVLPSFRATK